MKNWLETARDDLGSVMLILCTMIWLSCFVAPVSSHLFLFAQTAQEQDKPASTEIVVKCSIERVKKEYGASWTAKGYLKAGDDVLFDGWLPLPWPATDDEAWKACKHWRKERVPKEIEKWRKRKQAQKE